MRICWIISSGVELSEICMALHGSVLEVLGLDDWRLELGVKVSGIYGVVDICIICKL